MKRKIVAALAALGMTLAIGGLLGGGRVAAPDSEVWGSEAWGRAAPTGEDWL